MPESYKHRNSNNICAIVIIILYMTCEDTVTQKQSLHILFLSVFPITVVGGESKSSNRPQKCFNIFCNQ